MDNSNGMRKLFNKNRNAINTITTKETYNYYKDILKKLKDKASKASTKEIAVKPDITTRQEAQDGADRLNQIYQAVLGVKEGFNESYATRAAPMPSPRSSNRPTDKTRALTTTRSMN